MIEITSKDFVNQFKNKNFSILLIYADGCEICEKAKPEYLRLSEKFPNYKFFQWKLDENSYSFYEQYEEKHPVKEIVMEDGSPILDARGQPLMKTSRDENGNPIMKAIIQVPKFYVFHGDEAKEGNEYGLLGKVDGFNMPMLENILTQISELEKLRDTQGSKESI